MYDWLIISDMFYSNIGALTTRGFLSMGLGYPRLVATLIKISLFHLWIEISYKYTVFVPGRAWSAATTEGLVIFSLDASLVFDPYDLDTNVTPENIRKVLSKGEFSRALCLSFRLNEQDLIREVVESIKINDSK